MTANRNQVREPRMNRAQRREAARIAQTMVHLDAQTAALMARTADALGYSWGPSVLTVQS